MQAQRPTVSHPTLFQRPARPVLFHGLEVTGEILSSVAVLPEQVYDASAVYKECGEVALMRAVLEDAIHCFQKQSIARGRRARRLAKEVEEWFFTNDYRWPFSFVNICAVLGLEPEHIRLGLKRWHQYFMVEPPQRKQHTSSVRGLRKIAA